MTTAKKTEKPDEGLDRRYRALVEIIPDIVYRLDPEGTITFVNSCVRNLGYEPEELVGSHFSAIIHPDDIGQVSRSPVLERFRGQVTGDERAPKLFDERRSGVRMTKGLEVRLVPKGWQNGSHDECIIGSLFSVGEVSALGVYNPDNSGKEKEFLGTVGIIRDITQRKRDEENRQRLEQQYQQAKRLEGIGLLAGGLAHDFKNLLTIALGYIEVAGDQCEPGGTISQYLTKAFTALQRSKNLTQQLLNFSKAGVVKKRPIEFGRVLRNSVSIAIGESGVKPVFSIDKNLRPMEADEGQITQVIENIVMNACHAMPSGGTLEVTAENAAIGPCDLLPLKNGTYVKVSIKDHGTGISPEHLSKIFDPFFTTKQDGSGLGLTTSFFIISNHHGHLCAASELGKGTTLTFYLPAAEAEA